MFEIFGSLLAFWMDNLLICSQTEEEHLKHLELVFETFRGAGMKN